MARPSKQQRLADLHAEALADFDTIQAAQRDERMQCLEDRRFYSVTGAQWEGPLGEQFENKPRFEFNKVHLAVIRIINEYRNNRVTVDFQTKDGSTDDEMADTCDGLYRADEKACTADEAYDNAFEEATAGGMGAWRLRSTYENEEDEDDEKQRIVIEPIFDADSCVFFNLDAKRQDKADAKRCWVLTPYTHEAFEEEFGHSPSSWPKTVQRSEFDWCTPDVVWVAEFYQVEETTETVRYFKGIVDGQEEMKVTEADLAEDANLLDDLKATGFKLAREKKIKRRRVHKYLMSGLQVEEDCGYIAGRHIPIVTVYGKRWVVDGIERCMGHVRLAKDAQRLANLLMSWLAEMAMRFDIEKPILTPEQIAGHATMWSEDNIKKYPYLLANAMKDADGNPVPGSQVPAAYTKAPNMPPAMAALMQLAAGALQELLGSQEAGEQLQPNMSGKAVELIQNRLDMQVFIYMSNFAKGMKRSGEIWLSMMKDIAVEASRRMKTITPDGETGSVELNHPAFDAETGAEYVENDLSKADFDVDVSVGPSSSSLRSSVVRALTGVATITDDPETKQALTLATIANLEGEGLGDLRDWARAKAVRMGLIKPTDEEKEQLAAEQQNQQPDAQTQYLAAAAKEADAKAAKANADTIDTLAAADLKQAQTAKTLSETAGVDQQQVLDAAEAVRRAAMPPEGAQSL